MTLRIHPDNPKLFEFRGWPLVLLTATEHYGAVMNRPFDFEKYLADAAENRITLTRLFTLFRELQGPNNPWSTCKPETPDYIAPFKRIDYVPGAARALDGGLKYDLAQWNPEFFDRLHRFLSLASQHGIAVEVVLLSNTYYDGVWSLNPLNPHNNINAIPEFHWPEYMSLRQPAVWQWQSAHVRKIVEETNRYDNIFYEICNEPGGAAYTGREGNPSPTEVDEWQAAIANLIRETEAKLPNQHLIAGQEAFTWSPKFIQTSDKSFQNFREMNIVNMHPLPDTTFAGKTYDMGSFMAKELKLRAVRDYALATYDQPKPLNYDEDNSSTQYKDVDAWTIHRKRAWTTLFCGGHYDMIDFSITIHTPAGTPESRKYLRTWMGHLSRFIHSIDLVRARPVQNFLHEQPAHTVESVLAIPGRDYSIYLADGRELGEPGAGRPIHGPIRFDLPEGDYQLALIAPVSGLSSPVTPLHGGKNTAIELPPFEHDIVIRITKV